ncbi:arylsulfatase A-like enzyme [Lewinella aquimaris]|uniref:Arylsulfatase A-like enzyme n=1 Tax=Neolewinella aquimaris TaxID=1835722 RepID=A0A840EGB7_9BACT|nr:arylsulfatase [Neolewinella aquimaris]MBB4080948.1 arylsulfatase A-like enzyme [Neolewinella aquimaris]
MLIPSSRSPSASFSAFAVLLLLLFVSTCAKKPTGQASQPDKPNVIIVITDDQGYGDLGHTGNPIIQTPAIDRFAMESVSLTNYHVGTTCAPTRAGLLTGRNCNRNGVWHTILGASMLNEDETTLADVFRARGYATGMFGKWHLGDNHPFLPQDRGFDVAFYHGGGGVGQTPDYWNNDYFDDTYFRNGTPEQQSGYCTDVWFDEAIQFISDEKDEPFLCYLSLNAPHSPYNVPEAYYNRYADEDRITDTQKRFYGMITNIDDNFARLLRQLDELGIADNTIVIFTTDNGTAAGYQVNKRTDQVIGYNAEMRGTKGSEYEGGHRVPFIVRWPAGGLTDARELPALTAHVDVLPTLVSLTGQTYQSTKVMDGTDISGYLLGNNEAPDRLLVTDTQRVPWPEKGKNSCVMEGDWRLINGKELYEVSEDPGQSTDVATAYPDRVQRMNDFYDSWWTNVIAETKLSVIELGREGTDVITTHDARINEGYSAWNQTLIRRGEPTGPGPYAVKFTEKGKYRFRLHRWPVESGLALGAAIHDSIPPTAYTDARINGNALNIEKAYLKIGERTYTTDVDQSSPAATIEADVAAGETELLAYFDLAGGQRTNAFYVYVERVEN